MLRTFRLTNCNANKKTRFEYSKIYGDKMCARNIVNKKICIRKHGRVRTRLFRVVKHKSSFQSNIKCLLRVFFYSTYIQAANGLNILKFEQNDATHLFLYHFPINL